MATVNGRGLRKPQLVEVYTDEGVTLRIADPTNPEFWLTLTLSTADLVRLNATLADWHKQSAEIGRLWEGFTQPN